MSKDGIHAGDPLIEMIVEKLDNYSINHKLTSQSGAKKGDGDIHTKGLLANIAFDGKYVEKEPVNPKFLASDIDKVTRQANSCDRYGVIATNCQEGIMISMNIDTFLSLLQYLKVEQ